MIFAESHVEHQVEFVLDPHVVADTNVEGVACQQAADVVALLTGRLAADGACRLDPNNGPQPHPVLVAHPYDGIGIERVAEPDLYPPMPLVHVRVLGRRTLVVAHRLHVLHQSRLDALDSQVPRGALRQTVPSCHNCRPHISPPGHSKSVCRSTCVNFAPQLSGR